jgi:serine/threonine-protein kinase
VDSVDPLDEAVVRCCRDAERGPSWLAAWLGRHPELAADLANFLADQSEMERRTAPLRDLFAEEALTTEQGSSPSAGAPLCVPGYEILGELGRGGMGVVYEALQAKANRPVALKTIRTGEFASALEIARFRYEAEAAASLDHPHVVPIFEVGESGGLVFYSMKRLSNGSLANRLRQGPRPDPKQTARLLAAVARAVQHAHGRGIIHRDLKPANVLLDEHDQPHVSDFGLARRVDAAHSIGPTGAVVGTAEYAAPEQLRGDHHLTAAVDVYGLGAILYECLTGRPPFRGGSVLEVMSRVQRDLVVEPRRLAPDVPADLEAICLRCLSKEPAERYGSAEAVAVELERFLRGESRHERPPILTWLWKAVTRPPELPGLITGPALWYSAAMTFAWHGGVFLLGLLGAPLLWVWVVFLAGSVLALLTMWHYHGRSPRSLISAVELSSSALHLAAVAAQLVWLGLVSLAVGDLAAPCAGSFVWLYPALAVNAGMTTFAHAVARHGGWHYLIGLALMALALPLRLLPGWSPLVYASVTALLYVVSALVLPRFLPTR